MPMKVTIRRADPLGDDVSLELERGIQRDRLQLRVVFDDGSGQGITIIKQDLIDALKSL